MRERTFITAHRSSNHSGDDLPTRRRKPLAGRDARMSFGTDKKRTASLRLERRYLSFAHACGTRVHRAIGRAFRFFIDIHNRTRGGLRSRIALYLAMRCFELSQFVFEITYAVGHRVLLVGECLLLGLEVDARSLDVNDSVKQRGARLSKLGRVACVNCHTNQVGSTAQSSERARNHVNHGCSSQESGDRSGCGDSDFTPGRGANPEGKETTHA